MQSECQTVFANTIRATAVFAKVTVPAKSDSDVILCLQLLSKTLT